ncbi:uncharacterized protein MONBRDRAFT_2764, partial [Monosiga brevicollis MX1]
SSANFGRFMLPELLPELNRVLYIDIDTVVQGDLVALLAHMDLGDDDYLAAVPRPNVPLSHFFGADIVRLHAELHPDPGQLLQLAAPSFNAGVAVWNLRAWRQRSLRDEVLYYMTKHHEHALWDYGTQPILLLVCAGHWQPLDVRFNLDGLGYRTDVSTEALDGAYVLHWSGRRKPWQHDALYRQRWTRFVN